MVMPKSYHYFGYCLLLLSEAEMPSEKRRIQERETTKGGSKEEIRNQERLSDLLLLREGHTNRQRRGSEGFSFEALHF